MRSARRRQTAKPVYLSVGPVVVCKKLASARRGGCTRAFHRHPCREPSVHCGSGATPTLPGLNTYQALRHLNSKMSVPRRDASLCRWVRTGAGARPTVLPGLRGTDVNKKRRARFT
jgi:hypothetical protein